MYIETDIVAQSICLKTLIFKVLHVLKMCPISVGSVNNFGKSDNDINELFCEKVLISNRCISGLMSNLIKKSWTDSTLDQLGS